ncbi:MAG TPA: hypothetical protein VEI06_07635 [Gemmatimonadaceae bacterium]|nr:hypothetical protein [Gemmatimonadaceae bacterium]
MLPSRLLLSDPALRHELAAGLEDPPTPDASALAATLARWFGPSTLAVLHYGSHAQRADPRPESAYDFFVIVDSYRKAYGSLATTVGTSYRPRVATLLSHVLPPNVIAVKGPEGAPTPLAKCAVLSLRHLRRACSSRPDDHFVAGRLFQYVQLAWFRDAQSWEATRDAVIDVRARSFDWGRAFLPERFDAETYYRTLLEVSYSAEIRPEQGERLDAIASVGRDTVLRGYALLLQQLATLKLLVSDGKVYRLAESPGWWLQTRVRLYFERSKLRATARWSKYVALYDDWLDYVLEKISRRSGVTLELTPRERRHPLIFLWPKAFRYLRSRPQRDR